MKRLSRRLPFFLLLSAQCLLISTFAQNDIDSNQVLTDFIWSKIISTKNSRSASSSKPHIPIVTIPYKPSSSKSKSLSRRSSYSLSAPSSSLRSSSGASSTSFFDTTGTNKYVSNTIQHMSSPSRSEATYSPFKFEASTSQTSESTVEPPVPKVKSSSSSYSGSENGKNYFSLSAIQGQASSKNVHETSKSLYDLVPMPTYGGLSKYSSGSEQNGLFQKKRTLEIMPMIREGQNGKQYNQQQQMEPQIIEVTPDDQPIQIVFRSTSTPVQVKQVHTPSKQEEVQPQRTEEEPMRVLHQLLRPVIQEVMEVIQPYRRVTQEIRPVQEEIHTVVSKQAPGNGAQGQKSQNGVQASAEQFESQNDVPYRNGYSARASSNSFRISSNRNEDYGNKEHNYG